MKFTDAYSKSHPGRNARLRLLILLMIVLSGVVVMSACGATGGTAAYGDKVKFRKGAVLKFPDFELTYTGERKVTSPVFKPGFIYHDFTAVKGSESITVSWSSGTGSIGPQWFEMGGKKLQLELRYADKVGRLGDNELVVSRR